MSTTNRRPEDEEKINPVENTQNVLNQGFNYKKWNGGSGVGAQAGQLAQNVIDMNYTDWSKGTDYASLTERYSQQGRKAMDDTLGTVSARTGGLASSYAMAVGNQAYNNYMTKLEDAARALYDSQRAQAKDNYGIAQGIYDRQYDEWQDDRNFGYDMYQDKVDNAKWLDTQLTTQSNTDREWDHKVGEEEEDELYAYLYANNGGMTYEEYMAQNPDSTMNEATFNRILGTATGDYANDHQEQTRVNAQNEIKVQLEANANAEISPELLAASGWSEGTIQAYRDLYAKAEGKKVAEEAQKRLANWIANGGSVTGDDVPDDIKAYIQASGYSEAELQQMVENRGYTTSQKQVQEQVLAQFAAGRYPETADDISKIAEETGWDVATVLAYQDYYEKVADEDATKESMAADTQILTLVGAGLSWDEITANYGDAVEASNYGADYWQRKITQHEQNQGFTNAQLIMQDNIMTKLANGKMPNQTEIAQSGRDADYWAAYKNAMTASGGLTDPDDIKTWTDLIIDATPDKVGGYFSALDKIDEDLAFSLLTSWAKASPENRGAVFEELIGEPLD